VILQDVDCLDAPGFVRFEGRASKNATAYHWDFGDGATSRRPAPLHAYEFTGPTVFTVKLTVTGPGGTDAATSKVTTPCP
jgi:PKD repeat protein